MRVVAAMSGGVDSAVAAARMVQAGHQVVGVHMALQQSAPMLRESARGCCTLEDAGDARRVADKLGIPFYVWDFSEQFQREVVADFTAEYAAGRTPNPCLRCNEKIKFTALLERALALGFDAVATGHYAQLRDSPDGPELHRAADRAKDQSYVLGVLTAQQLGSVLFPLGSDTKDQVRASAAGYGFAVAAKPDSHDICFIPDGDTRGYLERQLGQAAGDIVDAATQAVVGRHHGTHAFTIGQRRGLGIERGKLDGQPRFVTGIDPQRNIVTIGTSELLSVTDLVAKHVRWCGRPPSRVTELGVQLRAHGRTQPAVVRSQDDRLQIGFSDSVRGVALGQSAVLYDDTRVVGSGTICDTNTQATKSPVAR